MQSFLCCEYERLSVQTVSIYVNTKDNKYRKWYNNLIERARNRVINGYTEEHHIIPRSIGGTNEDINLVRLTAREHLIAHMLLPRFIENCEPMWRALWCMVTMGKVRVTSKLYEQIKIKNATIDSLAKKGIKPKNFTFKGKKHTAETKLKMSMLRKGRVGTMKNKKHTSETKLKMSMLRKGQRKSAQAILNMSLSRKGKARSPEIYTKISMSLKGRPWSEARRNAQNKKTLL